MQYNFLRRPPAYVPQPEVQQQPQEDVSFPVVRPVLDDITNLPGSFRQHPPHASPPQLPSPETSPVREPTSPMGSIFDGDHRTGQHTDSEPSGSPRSPTSSIGSLLNQDHRTGQHSESGASRSSPSHSGSQSGSEDAVPVSRENSGGSTGSSSSSSGGEPKLKIMKTYRSPFTSAEE